jgi:hypothetical protein
MPDQGLLVEFRVGPMNHYAAAVIGSRLPLEMMPTSRGRRIMRKSPMNLLALVIHRLSAISVYGEATPQPLH